MSSSGPHRLFRFLFTVAVVVGFPGAAEEARVTVGEGADEAGQAAVGGRCPKGLSGGGLPWRQRLGVE